MTKNKHFLLTIAALLFCFQLFSQSKTIEVQGRVVEVTDGKPVGVPNVKVNVEGHYDITDQYGHFRLFIHRNAEAEAVFISLQNCQHPLISPRAGRVNLPPSGDLEIRVCAKANRRLQEQVKTLENKVKTIGQKHRLSEYQLAEMYERMMDTIVYFEREIQSLESQLGEKQDENENLKQRIDELSGMNSDLQDQLQDALAQKYLRQNEYFEEISSGFNEYLSTLYDFKDKLPRIAACYSNQAAYGQMEAAKQRYSAARDHINSRHDAWVAEVQSYWDAPHAAEQLAETCRFLLQTVHDEQVYVMNESVFGPMKDWSMGKTSQGKARKKSEAAVETAMPELNGLTTQLERKIEAVKSTLRNTL